jgi:hypothetical protein
MINGTALVGEVGSGAIGISKELAIPVLSLGVPSASPAPESLPVNPPAPPAFVGNLEAVNAAPERGAAPIIASAAGAASEGEERYYELRIVTFDENGEPREHPEDKIPLNDEKLKAIHPFNPSKLPALFGRLPADRYRIYLIEDGTERLILDFIIQQGQPIETPEVEEVEADPAADAANPFGDDQAESQNHDDGAAATIGHWLPAIPTPPPADASSGGTASFAERLGNASFVSHGGVVLGAVALTYAAGDKWEKSIERLMERFDRRRRLPPWSRRTQSESRTRNTTQREPAHRPL